MIEYVEKILVPYINSIIEPNENFSPEQPSTDYFTSAKSWSILLSPYNLNVSLLPANCTDRLQPLDLSVNTVAKDFLHSKFQEWYAKQLCSQLQEGSETQAVATIKWCLLLQCTLIQIEFSVNFGTMSIPNYSDLWIVALVVAVQNLSQYHTTQVPLRLFLCQWIYPFSSWVTFFCPSLSCSETMTTD